MSGNAATDSPAKLLHSAKNAAGDFAVKATEREDYTLARQWQALAVEIDLLLRNSVELMAS